jgi:hypothetical protein
MGWGRVQEAAADLVYVHSFDKHYFASARSTIAACKRRAHGCAVVTHAINEKACQVYYLADAQALELRTYARVCGNYVSVSTVLDHVSPRNG